MAILRRKRFRRLRDILFGPPGGVIPVPALGGYPPLRGAPSDHWLWAEDMTKSRGLRLSPPEGEEWTRAWERVIQCNIDRKLSNVTYDPEAARDRLVGMLQNPQGQPYPLKDHQ